MWLLRPEAVSGPWRQRLKVERMYRYSDSKYNALLLAMGCIRVGTLHNFRRSEHKRGIADPQEGRKQVSHYIKDLHVADSNAPSNDASTDFRALSAFGAVKMEGARNITFKNVAVAREFDSPNFFVLCTSALGTKRTMHEFDGADSCVEIVDITSFYRVLTEALDRITPVEFQGIHQVFYKDRSETWNGRDWGCHPALIKAPSYSPQAELRAIWRPRFEQPIQPVVTGHYRLGEFCKAIDL